MEWLIECSAREIEIEKKKIVVYWMNIKITHDYLGNAASIRNDSMQKLHGSRLILSSLDSKMGMHCFICKMTEGKAKSEWITTESSDEVEDEAKKWKSWLHSLSIKLIFEQPFHNEVCRQFTSVVV